jgi:uncharacterized protein YxjI
MLLHLQQFFIKERVAVLKLTDTYDIFDPATGEQVGTAKEEPGGLATVLRLLINKRMLPTKVNIYEGERFAPILTLRKKIGFIRTKVEVLDADGQKLGHFRSKLFSLGGGFQVFDAEGGRVGEVKGDWKGWNFRLLDATGEEIGVVTKKWAGLGRELFTSADNYIISLSPAGIEANVTPALVLAAGLAIDIVYKEG